MPGSFGNGRERVIHRIVWPEVLRAWTVRQRRSHKRLDMFEPIHQNKRPSGAEYPRNIQPIGRK